jgi:diadenosine tetraphosphate (Ap4A) HIT family hydrolase
VTDCALCRDLRTADPLAANELAVGMLAGYPVSPGHTLIVPRRHEPDFFSLADPERLALCGLLEGVRSRLDSQFRPDAYNVGLNNGTAAGQTIPHVHLHVIPRYAGDVEDPRGGVRWVLPKAARYW